MLIIAIDVLREQGKMRVPEALRSTEVQKDDEKMSFTAMWMDLASVTLSEVN